MNYAELLQAARGQMGPCRACPVCNGRACANAMPGPGCKYPGNAAARNFDKWQEIFVNMDTLCPNTEVDVSFELFGHRFAAPIFAAPLGSIDLHYGPKYKDHAYNSILVKAAAEYGVMALTGDGVDPTIMLSSVEDMKKVGGIAGVANIPEVAAQKPLIEKILHTDYLETAGIPEFEQIRGRLRDLMKYIPQKQARYDTDFTEEILSTEWKDAELENGDLRNYKAKAEFYLRQHQDQTAIAKLRGNQPLSRADVDSLEAILWGEVGTKEEYEAEYGHKPLGELVREVVGLDMNAAKTLFAAYLDGVSLNADQIYFVNQIIEYVVRNGLLKDFSVLQEAPFNDRGSVVEVFTDLSVWARVREAIDCINKNACVA